VEEHVVPDAQGVPLEPQHDVTLSTVLSKINTGNRFLDLVYCRPMTEWSFLTNHARALLLIAQDSGTRLRDLATALDVTERTAYGIVVDLTEAGYVVKERDGRRNRYQIREELPLPDPIGHQRTVREVLDLLVEARRRGGRRTRVS
jgi:DNA-binding transcriptional ArsR family regulator